MINWHAGVEFPEDGVEYTVEDFTESPEQIAKALANGDEPIFCVTVTIPGRHNELGDEDERITLVATAVTDEAPTTIECAITNLDEEPCPTGTQFVITWNPEGTHTIRCTD